MSPDEAADVVVLETRPARALRVEIDAAIAGVDLAEVERSLHEQYDAIEAAVPEAYRQIRNLSIGASIAETSVGIALVFAVAAPVEGAEGRAAAASIGCAGVVLAVFLWRQLGRARAFEVAVMRVVEAGKQEDGDVAAEVERAESVIEPLKERMPVGGLPYWVAMSFVAGGLLAAPGESWLANATWATAVGSLYGWAATLQYWLRLRSVSAKRVFEAAYGSCPPHVEPAKYVYRPAQVLFEWPVRLLARALAGDDASSEELDDAVIQRIHILVRRSVVAVALAVCASFGAFWTDPSSIKVLVALAAFGAILLQHVHALAGVDMRLGALRSEEVRAVAAQLGGVSPPIPRAPSQDRATG